MVRDRTDADGGIDLLPEVLFLDDVAALLHCSPATIKRRLRAQVFPVPPLPGIDKRPRWSKASFAQRLAVGGSDRAVPSRRRWTA